MPSKPKELPPDAESKLELMSGLGMRMSDMAAIFGIHKSTLERRVAGDDALAAALEKGRAKASLNVITTAYRMATDGEHPVMTIFWLKCRERWNEGPQRIEHSATAIQSQTRMERIRASYGDSMVRTFDSPDSRRRVLNALKKFSDLGDKIEKLGMNIPEVVAGDPQDRVKE